MRHTLAILFVCLLGSKAHAQVSTEEKAVFIDTLSVSDFKLDTVLVWGRKELSGLLLATGYNRFSFPTKSAGLGRVVLYFHLLCDRKVFTAAGTWLGNTIFYEESPSKAIPGISVDSSGRLVWNEVYLVSKIEVFLSK